MNRLLRPFLSAFLAGAALSAAAAQPEPQLGAFNRIVIPTGAYTAGAGGAFYQTKLSILNVTTGAYDIEAILYGSSGQAAVKTIHMSANGAANFGNALVDLFPGASPGTSAVNAGAMVFNSHGAGDFIVTEEVFNDKAGCGHFKTVVTGGPILEPSLPGFDSFTIGLTIDADNRTNYGIFNDSDGTITVTGDVFDAGGNLVKTFTEQRPSKTWFQNNLANQVASLAGGFVRWRTTGTAFIWAVTVSNDSGDGTFIPAADVVPAQ
jgi:hypothetical protein